MFTPVQYIDMVKDTNLQCATLTHGYEQLLKFPRNRFYPEYMKCSRLQFILNDTTTCIDTWYCAMFITMCCVNVIVLWQHGSVNRPSFFFSSKDTGSRESRILSYSATCKRNWTLANQPSKPLPVPWCFSFFILVGQKALLAGGTSKLLHKVCKSKFFT